MVLAWVIFSFHGRLPLVHPKGLVVRGGALAGRQPAPTAADGRRSAFGSLAGRGSRGRRRLASASFEGVPPEPFTVAGLRELWESTLLGDRGPTWLHGVRDAPNVVHGWAEWGPPTPKKKTGFCARPLPCHRHAHRAKSGRRSRSLRCPAGCGLKICLSYPPAHLAQPAASCWCRRGPGRGAAAGRGA